MAFPEWVFTFLPSLPCLVINFIYSQVLVFLSLSMCCSKAGKYKQFEKLNSEVRSLLPLFKEGSSPNELLLFNFRVPNSRSFVLMVNYSVMYVVLVAVAIFFQTAFIEEAKCHSKNDNLFCYLNGSSIKCSDFNYSPKTANCYGIIVRFGDATANAAGVFSFYIIAFGSLTYILLKSSGGKTGHKLQFWFTIILYHAVFIVLSVLYYTLGTGIRSSRVNDPQYFSNFNYLIFMSNVSLTSFRIPWWKFNKRDEERSDENLTQRQLEAP